jgi:XTP/dITP diphosphohydrolase
VKPGEVVLATRSTGKLRELRPMLSDYGLVPLTLDDVGIAPAAEEDALECHETFETNAEAKARYFFLRAEGRPVLADDSGLEVDALDARPGVRSKRWSGRMDLEGAALDAVNNALLLAELDRAALSGRDSRSARYVCAASCVWIGGAVTVRGEAPGTVLPAPRGAGGFGYDPYLWSPELGATFAEVSPESKSMVSHRGRAFSALLRAVGPVLRELVVPG